ncbi:deaminase [Nibricoccus aquaticus]|uniref:Deaminase n=1 Tax=Nibricoccus aquaticus TaxID=2576891 RepID=A0A290QHH8_9BACT|nr:dihydrofolate reductase family protein [Nibricoccus aquaticus]ATC65756.1 deaminase [Nibricoccus aquaticus]
MRVTLIAAQSLDGFITKHAAPGSDFASSADQVHLRNALAGFDCSVMGAETYRTARTQIRERLTPPRLRTVLTRSPQNFAADTLPGLLEFSSASPAQLLADLSARALRRCALLGGAQIHSLFLNSHLIDELWLTVEPALFGRGTPLLAQATDTRLRLLSQEKLAADTILLKYEVLR